MAYFMGIDIGSRTSKGIVLSPEGDVLASDVRPTGTDYGLGAATLRDQLLRKIGVLADQIAYTVATGQSVTLPFASEYVTDIQCCARGVHRTCPSARTIIDIQAQISQVIRLGESGLANNFVVSEKCAAGSGRFLDIIAHVLQVEIEEIGPLSMESTKAVAFSTGCAVFGESEAISRVAEGAAKEDILAGVHRSIADKISALAAQVGVEGLCAIVGGGALDDGLVKSIEEKLGVRAMVPARPQLIHALGAAATARERR